MANLRTNNLCGEGGTNAIKGSVYFDGYVNGTGSSYLSIADNDDLDMGTGDFTVEAWIKPVKHAGTNDPNYMGFFSSADYGSSGSITIQVKNDGKLRYIAGNGGDDETGSTVLWGHWHHIAIVRSSGTIKGYVNGVEEISSSYSSAIDFGTGGSTVIGELAIDNYAGDYAFRGYISNLRVCKGHAVYTAAFTPPTSELGVHYNSDGDETVLLCCQDSDNALQEATGKTITGVGRHADSSVELVPNGGPTTDVTGWTAYNSSVAYDTGQIKVTRSGGTGFSAYATITNAVAGQRYKVSAQIRSVSSRADLYVTTAVASGTLLSLSGTASATVDVSGFFTATATTLYVFTAVDGDGDIGYYNRVSVKAADYGDVPKVIPPYGVDAGNTFGGAISMNSLSWMYFPTGKTEERGRGRALFGGGETPSQTNSIEFVNVQSMGIAKDFGDFTSTSGDVKGLGSSTRGVFRVDNAPSLLNTLEFITFANQSNATDFGDLVVAVQQRSGASNQTRGIFSGGLFPGSTVHNDMDYITIATLGNAADFGNLSVTRGDTASLASPTRLLIAGGWTPSTSYGDVIDYVTIATTGNAADFGDLNTGKRALTAVASSTRGVFGPGKAPSVSNVIDFVTIASTGNATDFGDALVARGGAGSASNSIRGLFAGGYSPSKINGIEFINIATTGNGADFGDMTFVSQYGGGCSDSHGGIS